MNWRIGVPGTRWEVCGSLASGELYLGSFHDDSSWRMDTGYSAVADLKVVDLSGVRPEFGTESLLICGWRADGRSQVSVMARDVNEDPTGKAITPLPIVGDAGEIFCRVGTWNGAIIVFDARDRKFVAFVDSDGDAIPDFRLATLYTMISADTPYVSGPIPPPNGAQPGAFLLYDSASHGRGLGLISQGNALIESIIAVPTKDRVVALRGFEGILCAGMTRVGLFGEKGDQLSVQVMVAGTSTFAPWASPITLPHSGFVVSAQAATPLAIGDTIRLDVDGDESTRFVITADPLPVTWKWGWTEAAAFSGAPFVVEGQNLQLVSSASWVWFRFGVAPGTPPSSPLIVSQSVGVTPDPSGNSITISSIQLPSGPGQLRVQFYDGNGNPLTQGPRLFRGP